MEGEKFNNPYIDDLVGIPQKSSQAEIEKSRLLKDYIEKNGSKKIEGLELEKTPKDIEILHFAEDGASALLRQYGREKDVEVPMEHIHVLKIGGTEEYTEGRISGGSHAPTFASILVDRNPSDISFCLVAFHELLHLKSFKTLQATLPKGKEERSKLKEYRTGFSVTSRDGKEKYFGNLEEGLIGLFTEQFFNADIRSSDLFRDELEKKDDDKELPELGRQKEANDLNTLIDELWEKNRDSFKDRKDILDLFVDAQVNGHLLKVGRLIENTLGKGSFRLIGTKEL